MSDKQVPEKGKLKSMLFSLWSNAEASKKEGLLEAEPNHGDEAEQAAPAEKTEAEPPEKDDNLAPVRNNHLYELYCRQTGRPLPENEEGEFPLSLFVEGGQKPDATQKNFLKSLNKEASSRLSLAKHPDEEPQQAYFALNLTADRMSAYVFVFPPLFGGGDIVKEDLCAGLASKGIVFGADEEKMEAICREKQYFTLFKVAEGLPPENGKDGEIVDHYRRDVEIQLMVKEDNTIDYKDLNWLQTVLAEDVICDIVPPTPAVMGKTVLGQDVKGRDGRKAIAPKGNGTKINQEETQLQAAQDGVLSFISQRFRVDPLLIIKGNVDTAVGNLKVVGDVLINGDIQEGFTVTATGNITVQGMIEGATVVAGGNVQVGCGMNGNSTGSIETKGDVLCKFIENGTVNAGGKIVCDTIINSNVSSDTAIEVKTGRGSIIGGNISALERIDALSIGNQSNRSMVISLGSTARFLQEKRELELKRRDVANEVTSLIKDIGFLSRPGYAQNNPKAEKALADMKLRLTVQKMQLANLDRQVEEMEAKQADNSKCRIRAEVLYPPIQLSIGNVSKSIREIAYNALVYSKDGEIHIANV